MARISDGMVEAKLDCDRCHNLVVYSNFSAMYYLVLYFVAYLNKGKPPGTGVAEPLGVRRNRWLVKFLDASGYGHTGLRGIPVHKSLYR